MTRPCFFSIPVVCAGLALAAYPGYATNQMSTKTVGTLPPLSGYTFQYNGQTQRKAWQPTTTATTAERSKAIEQAVSKKAAPKASPTPGSWTSLYTLYVNCPTAPSDVDFTTIQNAVNHALEYTTIKVCYGTGYAGEVVVPTSYVKIIGQGNHMGDQTIFGTGGADPTDDSFGIVFTGSNDVVENITFQDLEFGVLSGVLIQDQDNVVDHNWFNNTSIGTGSIGGSSTLIEKNTFTTNYYPIISVGGVNETITCNTVTGDAAGFFTDGIAIFDSVSATVTSNVVSNSINGLDFGFFNTYAMVESNHFDGNVWGIDIYLDNSGNTFEKNQVNGNYIDGIYSDGSSGLDATVDNSGVNSFVKNTTLGSEKWDIYDDTAGYAGFAEGNNEETADYYSGNTGDLYSSYPSDIYQQ